MSSAIVDCLAASQLVEMRAQKDVQEGEFTWKIRDFTKLTAKKLYSEAFTIGGCQWRIVLPLHRESNMDHLSMYLDAPGPRTSPKRWTKFSLSVIDQINDAESYKIEMHHYFTSNSDWGYRNFMPLSLLHDPTRGFLANDTLVVKAEICLLGFTPWVDSQPAIQKFQYSYDSHFNGLEELINAAEATDVRVGLSSCQEDDALRAEIPSTEEVEKAKQLLKENLSDLFNKLNIKEGLSEVLSTLTSARTGLTPEQQRAIETIRANSEDFSSSFSTYVQDNAELELHKQRMSEKLSAMKKCHETHTFLKKLMDDLIKGRDMLLAHWDVLLVDSEKAKSEYKNEQKKVAEAEEKKRITEERISTSITELSNLKSQFC